MRTRHETSGFSLVELSIVLVILGLLTGGILGGQALIRAAELRAVPTEYARYATAIRTFQDKYFSLPGDMTNATAFWGAADGNDGIGSDCRGAQTLDRRTCNGNGDGRIDQHPDLENTRFWQHLANAGLIEGTYVGTGLPYVTACNINTPGCAMPASKLTPGMWSMHVNLPGGGYTWPNFDNRNTLYLSTVPVNSALSPMFAPEEMWNIDTKTDDGLPGTGMVTASRIHYCDNSAFGVVTEAARVNARYRLNNNGKICVPLFMWQ